MELKGGDKFTDEKMFVPKMGRSFLMCASLNPGKALTNYLQRF